MGCSGGCSYGCGRGAMVSGGSGSGHRGHAAFTAERAKKAGEWNTYLSICANQLRREA